MRKREDVLIRTQWLLQSRWTESDSPFAQASCVNDNRKSPHLTITRQSKTPALGAAGLLAMGRDTPVERSRRTLALEKQAHGAPFDFAQGASFDCGRRGSFRSGSSGSPPSAQDACSEKGLCRSHGANSRQECAGLCPAHVSPVRIGLSTRSRAGSLAMSGPNGAACDSPGQRAGWPRFLLPPCVNRPGAACAATG
jgi:hypothetical protein